MMFYSSKREVTNKKEHITGSWNDKVNVKNKYMSDVVVHAFNSSTWEQRQKDCYNLLGHHIVNSSLSETLCQTNKRKKTQLRIKEKIPPNYIMPIRNC